MDEIRQDNIAYIKSREYYPELWPMNRIMNLDNLGKLNRAEFIGITGQEPPES